MQNRSGAFVLFVIMFAVMWNIVDYIILRVTGHRGLQLNTAVDGGTPVALGLIIGYFLIMRPGGR